MRNLIKKSLAFLLVAALALTCFVGTLTVSAEDATTPTATIVIKADDVEAGAKQIPVTFTVTSTLGINEALIKVSSNLGDIIAQPTVVVDEGVGTAIADPAVENPTDYNSFFLSAVSPDGQPETVMGEVKKATISAVFVNEAGLVAGETYTVDVEIPEGKVIAASAGEVAIKLECTKLEIVVSDAPKEPVVDNNINFNARINIADTINIAFIIQNAHTYDHFTFEIVRKTAKRDAANGNVYNIFDTEPNIVASENMSTMSDGIRYRHLYSGIGMYEFTLDITATIHCYDANNVEVATKTEVYTIAELATTLYNTASTKEVTKRMLTDLLNTGAAAQVQFINGKVCGLADAVPANKDFPQDFATQTFNKETLSVGSGNDASNAITITPGVNISLNPCLSYRLSGLTAEQAAGLTVKVTYVSGGSKGTASNDFSTTYTVDQLSPMSDQNGLKRYALLYDKITFYDSDLNVKLEAFVNGELIATNNYTVETYLKEKYKEPATSNLEALVIQLARLGTSVRNHFGTAR